MANPEHSDDGVLHVIICVPFPRPGSTAAHGKPAAGARYTWSVEDDELLWKLLSRWPDMESVNCTWWLFDHQEATFGRFELDINTGKTGSVVEQHMGIPGDDCCKRATQLLFKRLQEAYVPTGGQQPTEKRRERTASPPSENGRSNSTGSDALFADESVSRSALEDAFLSMSLHSQDGES